MNISNTFDIKIRKKITFDPEEFAVLKLQKKTDQKESSLSQFYFIISNSKLGEEKNLTTLPGFVKKYSRLGFPTQG